MNEIVETNVLNVRMSSVVKFNINGDMVRKFAELTGDHSLLHTKEGFARKSMYRQQVVHGMLPVGFISLLDFVHIEGKSCSLCSLCEISTQFIKPVFIDDTLSLTGEIVERNNEDLQVKLKYFIENEESKIIVTRGVISVSFLAGSKTANDNLSPGPTNNSSEILLKPLGPQDLKLEEISKGDTNSFQFVISEKSIHTFLEILQECVLERNPIGTAMFYKQSLPRDLLSTILYSTSVGMCVPGMSATFLEFTSNIEKSLKLNVPYELTTKVVHKSKSTRIIKNRISIHSIKDKQDVISLGKVNVLVNEPLRKMPSIKYLKESALDIGLKDKVVMITGASRGIGETTAKLFSLYGAKVIVNYFRGREDADSIVDEIKKEGGDAIALRVDVSDPIQVRKMMQVVAEKYKRIHVLVNNAVRDFRPIGFLSLSWEDIQRDIDVTVKGAFNCCKEVIPMMLEQGGGRIINISTVATDNPPPDQTKYVISKSALVGLSRSLSMEFAARNIQVNMVVPNFVETDLVSHIQEIYRKRIAQDTPMQRNASPVDVAQAVVFLASSYSSFTTGQKIMVTGGGPPYL